MRSSKRLSFLPYLVCFCGICVTLISGIPDAVCQSVQQRLRLRLNPSTFNPASFPEPIEIGALSAYERPLPTMIEYDRLLQAMPA